MTISSLIEKAKTEIVVMKKIVIIRVKLSLTFVSLLVKHSQNSNIVSFVFRNY